MMHRFHDKWSLTMWNWEGLDLTVMFQSKWSKMNTKLLFDCLPLIKPLLTWSLFSSGKCHFCPVACPLYQFFHVADLPSCPCPSPLSPVLFMCPESLLTCMFFLQNTQRGCESQNRGCEVHVNSVGDMTFPLVYSDCQMRVRALL